MNRTRNCLRGSPARGASEVALGNNIGAATISIACDSVHVFRRAGSISVQHEFSAGGDGDRAAIRVLWRSLAIVAAVTVLTAYFSDLFYFPDEHYQVLEFMSNKLGLTAPADM